MQDKKVGAIWLGVLLLAIFAHLARAQEAPKKLLVAHAGLISTHSSVWLAEGQGFFKILLKNPLTIFSFSLAVGG
jgi:hypothetical protein